MRAFGKLKSHSFVLRILLRKFALLFPLAVFATVSFAQQVVRGTVTSADTAVSSVTVSVKGSNVATQTDKNGNFNIAAGPTAVLAFSSVGYIAQEVPVKGRSTMNVLLVNEAQSLDQVVVVGYGTAKKATLTGSIVTVKGSELVKSPATNLSNSLAGRVPGVTVVTRSGEPGNDGSLLRIRGVNTLNDNSPLVVVDGIAGRQLERIDPSDVESITILKDASAAIYGARAANGVILITTKRGISGKPRLDISFNQGFVKPTVVPKMADAATYATMVNELKSYRNQAPQFTPDDIEKYKAGSDPWGHPNSDWFHELYKPTSLQRDAHVAIRGGTESIRYLVSAGYKYQDAIYRNSATNYSQGNFRANFDAKVSKNIKLSVDILASQENRNYPTQSAGNIYSSAMRGKPTIAARWPNGKPGPDIERGANPVVMATSETGYDKDILNNFISNARLEINIPWIKGLNVTANAAIDKNVDNHKLWQTPWFLYYWDGLTYESPDLPLLTKSSRGYNSPQLRQDFTAGNQTTLNALINYGTSIGGDHNIKALLGVERVKGDNMTFWAARKNYVSAAIDQLFAGADGLNQTNSGSAGLSARLNYFGRFNYNYREKYLAEFVFRSDGSYIFPAGKKQFGFFPGISLGWVVSKEGFWKNISPVINNLKIRGSWGQTGNDRIAEYQFLTLYRFASNPYVYNVNQENKALLEGTAPNPNVTWEVANQSNIGLDGQALNGKIFFSADYFDNVRSQLLIKRSASVPDMVGLTLPDENIGKVENRGFEFQLGVMQNIGDLTFTVSVNGGYQKNKILFFDETPGAPEWQKFTGHPMNSYLLYQAIGIFSDQASVDKYAHLPQARPGDIIFRDVDGDGIINGNDRVRNEKTDIPTFTGGLNIDIKYKNFYASVLFQGASGSLRKRFTFSGDSGNYLEEDANGRWTADNTDASKPRAWNFSDEYWMAQYNINNTYWLRNNDYIRLKNVEFGYNLPTAFINRAGIEAMTIYFTGLNLATFTKLKNYDPESNSDSPYPSNKVFNLGFNLTF
ncbi:MAG: TonB-dependent receptor [Ginsengibacter sp.]